LAALLEGYSEDSLKPEAGAGFLRYGFEILGALRLIACEIGFDALYGEPLPYPVRKVRALARVGFAA
jgi:hypothetical protein